MLNSKKIFDMWYAFTLFCVVGLLVLLRDEIIRNFRKYYARLNPITVETLRLDQLTPRGFSVEGLVPRGANKGLREGEYVNVGTLHLSHSEGSIRAGAVFDGLTRARAYAVRREMFRKFGVVSSYTEDSRGLTTLSLPLGGAPGTAGYSPNTLRFAELGDRWGYPLNAHLVLTFYVEYILTADSLIEKQAREDVARDEFNSK